MLIIALGFAVVGAIAGCSASTASNENTASTASNENTASASGAGSGPAPEEPSPTIELDRVENVWVFTRPGSFSRTALLSSSVILDGDCLRVNDGSAIIWHRDDFDRITEAVQALLRAESLSVQAGGGEIRVTDEQVQANASLREVVELCPADRVWVASPLPEDAFTFQ